METIEDLADSGLTPAFVVGAYLGGALLLFVLRSLLGARWRDAELELRGESALLPMGSRIFFSWAIHPIWLIVRRSGISANVLTLLSALLAVGTGMAVAAGSLAVGGWLHLAAGLCDFLDGRLARATGTASRRGAALDSIVDRYADAAVLVGLGWYFRDSWMLTVVMVALVGTFLVSYVRARGEALGASVQVGLMQRPERVVMLGFALAFNDGVARLLGPGDWLLVGALVFIALGANVTALHRLIHVLGALDDPASGAGVFSDRRGVPRAVVSATLATGLDFGAVMALVTIVGVSPWLATALGCVIGALVNFTVNRVWTFVSREQVAPQALRYAIVSSASALLNSGGVAVALLLPWPDYRPAWVLVRVLVFLCWNYPLQRDFVYRARQQRATRGTPSGAAATGRTADGRPSRPRERAPSVPPSMPSLGEGEHVGGSH